MKKKQNKDGQERQFVLHSQCLAWVMNFVHNLKGCATLCYGPVNIANGFPVINVSSLLYLQKTRLGANNSCTQSSHCIVHCSA